MGIGTNNIRLIVAGSRDFFDYEFVKTKLDAILIKKRLEEIQIVHGNCEGVDKLADRYAKERGYSIKKFPAQWSKYGKSAGPIRNREMAEYSTHCVCFWNEKSTGTKSMIDIATEHKLILRVIKIP